MRTLHYYDEIGLLKPTACNEAGYRLYDDKTLETLQQILFFKEFDMPLKDIKTILDNPNFNREKTLIEQRTILLLKRRRLDGLIKLINDILKGDNRMSFKEFSKEEIECIFQSMLANTKEEQLEVIKKNYGSIDNFKDNFMSNAGSEQAQDSFKKLVEWYGGKEEVMEVVKNPNSPEITQSYQNRILEIFKALSALKGEEATSFKVRRLVEEYEFISKQLYRLKEVKPLLLELAKEYAENEALIKANDEQFGKGSSVFVGKAIISFYQA